MMGTSVDTPMISMTMLLDRVARHAFSTFSRQAGHHIRRKLLER
jgi:hypothetical protein